MATKNLTIDQKLDLILNKVTNLEVNQKSLEKNQQTLESNQKSLEKNQQILEVNQKISREKSTVYATRYYRFSRNGH